MAFQHAACAQGAWPKARSPDDPFRLAPLSGLAVARQILRSGGSEKIGAVFSMFIYRKRCDATSFMKQVDGSMTLSSVSCLERACNRSVHCLQEAARRAYVQVFKRALPCTLKLLHRGSPKPELDGTCDVRTLVHPAEAF